MKDLRQVIRKPVITEKSTIERESHNIVTFAVHPDANKHEIKRAVETLFDVVVEDVRTLNVRGKMRRVGRHQGARPSWKKARVRLRAGDSIEFFEGV
ncbi:MAG TPA: 50S ribosomal protein L23 [Myxococcota bacterium]|nr:50S ribosomal protein L23 [Myxococcota bacterium]